LGATSNGANFSMTFWQLISVIVDGVFTVAIAGLIVLAGSFLHLVVLHYRHRKRGLADEAALMASPLPAASKLPSVLVQVPCYNEGRMIERILASLGELDWPKNRLTIQVIDQSDDGTTEIAKAAVAGLKDKGVTAEFIFRPVRVGFKAGALAEGLEKSNAAFVAVFDVDFIAPPDFLKRCMRAMLADDKLAFVQSRLDFANANRNWLTRAQRLILDAHYAVEQASRSWAGLPFQFDGTGGIWRRAAIDDVGGWDGKTLSEDLDLSFRVYLKGWRGRYLLNTTVTGEMPEALGDWQTQQNRWSKGFMQVTIKLLPPIWRASWPVGAKLAATLHIGLAAFHPLAMVGVVTAAIGIAVHRSVVPELLIAPGLLLLVGLTAIVGVTFPGHRLLRGGGVASFVSRFASLPPLFVYLAFANTKGVIEAVLGRASAFVRTPKKGANDPTPETD